ncbi:MAG: hypothetical protein KF870_13245 [Leadbetterella sp.]|nr:hypothetical protein [Leadbetterella sp.]
MDRKEKAQLLQRLNCGSITLEEFREEVSKEWAKPPPVLGGPIVAMIHQAKTERPEAYEKLNRLEFDESNNDLLMACADCLQTRPAAMKGISRCCEYKDPDDPICIECGAIKVAPIPEFLFK